MSRAKDPRFVRESQKMLAIVKRAILVIGILILILAFGGIATRKQWRSYSLSAATYEVPAGKVVYTEVKTGPGIRVKFKTDHSFYVVSGQPDGAPNKEYWLPGGESYCSGAEPSGPLVLKGGKTAATVTIYPQ